MKTRYYIAVLPPEPIATEIKNFKLYAGEHFGSYHALRSPAHITFIPPFHWADAEIDIIKNAIQSFATLQTPFEVTYNGFNCFPPRVVFIDVEPAPLLTQLKNGLVDYLFQTLEFPYKTKHREFNPHTTISYRYQDESQFQAAWAHFSKLDYQATFEVNSIVLFKHYGKEIGWKIDGDFSFE